MPKLAIFSEKYSNAYYREQKWLTLTNSERCRIRSEIGQERLCENTGTRNAIFEISKGIQIPKFLFYRLRQNN